MNRSFLTIAASLTVVATILSSAPTISDAASTTAESTYTASFTVQQPEKMNISFFVNTETGEIEQAFR